MNSKTKRELIEFITAMQSLASGCMLHVGLETTAEVMLRAENLKLALKHDETIMEVN